jgi:DNA-binding Lrp family transcriptional regulator
MAILVYSTKELKILAALRQNARFPLIKISKKTGIPISTIFDKLKEQEKDLIRKHTTLIDFEGLGYSTWVNVLLNVARVHKNDLRAYLVNSSSVNSVYQINNGFDFQAECVFRNVKELDRFLERIEDQFNILDKRFYFIIDDLKREEFLTNPDLVLVDNKKAAPD